MLDSRNLVSYPDAKETDDGYIYITYDRERGAYKNTMAEAMACAREILVARVTEEDILRGELTDPGSYLARIVNRLGAYKGTDQNPYKEYARYSDEELAKVLTTLSDKNKILSRVFDQYPLPCYAQDHDKLDAMLVAFEKQSFVDENLLAQIIAMIRAMSYEDEKNPTAIRIRTWVEKNFLQEWSLGDMAQGLCISKYYMCHLFKKEFGLSILEYRNSLRMTKAKHMLIGTQHQISRIATDCGFASASNFCELFHAYESMTPGDYRKLHK
jgi:AraC-like DNA-binding protein